MHPLIPSSPLIAPALPEKPTGESACPANVQSVPHIAEFGWLEIRPTDRLLPGWIISVALSGLIAFSALIVLIGWLIMIPPAPALIEKYPAAAAPPPAPELKPLPVADQARLPEEDPLAADAPPVAQAFPLRRRLPMPAEEPEAIVMTPMPPRMPTVEEPLAPLVSPLQWTTESPGTSSMNLIMPIEIARIDTGIPHTVRRLRLRGELPRQLKLAITPLHHDDLGSVLTKMGDGYRFTQLRKDDILSLHALNNHDVVFLTCADLYIRDFQAVRPLRRFVAAGGTLYASDLCGDLVQAAFPEFRAPAPILPGVPQSVEAQVLDSGLSSYLGRRSIPLTFDAPDWRPAAFDPNKVTVCLKGAYRNNLGQTWSVPLLVRFQYQKGTVIFTSFHHTKNDSKIVQKLLDYLVFAAVNARTESRVKELMQRSQFAPNEMRPALLNADGKLEATYKHTGGNLQIALGFENLGARLKLTLRSPSGQLIEHADQGLYLIEIPMAAPGEWRYTVSPIELPHANFPVIIAIGGMKT